MSPMVTISDWTFDIDDRQLFLSLLFEEPKRVALAVTGSLMRQTLHLSSHNDNFGGGIDI